MRVITCLAASLFLQSAAFAQLAPETVGTTTMPDPGTNWFIAKTSNGAYVWDAESGEMHGLLSLSRQTTTVAPYAPRGEFYAPESYYSRGVHGDRSDIVTVYDFENLAPIAEIDIPEKLAVLSIEGHLGLSNNGRFLGVFNMTPAQSITVVDVQNRAFVGEISTPGCAMILPVADRDFLMICGDGTLQLIRLDANGNEADRTRSNVFFSVQEDPVYDWPKRTRDGWLMISHAGKAYDVTIDGDDIDISEPWSIVTEEDAEEQWLHGRRQLRTTHRTRNAGGQRHGDAGVGAETDRRRRGRRSARLRRDQNESRSHDRGSGPRRRPVRGLLIDARPASD